MSAYDKDLTKQETFDNSFADLKKILNGKTKINNILYLVSEEYGTSVNADFQSTSDPKTLVQYTTGFQGKKFTGPTPIEISYTGNAEEFKLDDFLFDINSIAVDKLAGIVKEALAKAAEKCDGVSASQLRIELNNSNKPVINVYTEGKLKSNAIKKSYTYKTDLQGKFISM